MEGLLYAPTWASCCPLGAGAEVGAGSLPPRVSGALPAQASLWGMEATCLCLLYT